MNELPSWALPAGETVVFALFVLLSPRDRREVAAIVMAFCTLMAWGIWGIGQ